MARTPVDNGYGLFTQLQAALAPPDNGPKKPPRGGGKRSPGVAGLGGPKGPIGPGLSGPLPKSGAKVRA